MRLEISATVVADGLSGGDREFAPLLAVWSSFDAFREAQRLPLVQDATAAARYQASKPLGPYPLDGVLRSVRGDESLWFTLFVSTRRSGIDDIDKVEHDYVVRNMQAGTVQVPLGKILAAIDSKTGTGRLVDEDMIDCELLAAVLQKYREVGGATDVKKALVDSHKARLTLDIRLLDMDEASVAALRALSDALVHALDRAPGGAPGDIRRNSKTGALLYVPANYERFAQLIAPFIDEFVRRYVGTIDPATGKVVSAPTFDTNDPAIKNLHFAVYRSKAGMMPIISFWAHMYAHRHYATAEEREYVRRVYGYTFATERYFEAMMTASCRRFGMAPESFVAEVDAQLGRAHNDPAVSNTFRTVQAAVADFGTFVATSTYYMSDQRYPNAIGSDAGGALVATPLESFDITSLMLVGRANDCEDQGGVSTSSLRSVKHGREDVEASGPAPLSAAGASPENKTWESALLRAQKRVLDLYIICDVGGSVTAAWLGADGHKMEKEELKKMKELPRVDDERDRRNQNSGHAWGLMVPCALMAMWLENGGNTETPLSSAKNAALSRAARYPKWHYRLRTLVLEGTAPSDHFLLPSAELYAGGEQATDTRKAEAVRVLVRETMSTDAFKPLLEAFRPCSVPFYTRRVEPDRRITTFYRKVVHGTSVDLYQLHHGLSQFVFIDRRTKERGIDLADILRDGLDGDATKSVVALDVPFIDMVQEWDAKAVPAMEAMANQAPLTALGSVPKFQGERPLHFGVLTAETLEAHLAANAATTDGNGWLNGAAAAGVPGIAAPVAVPTSEPYAGIIDKIKDAVGKRVEQYKEKKLFSDAEKAKEKANDAAFKARLLNDKAQALRRSKWKDLPRGAARAAALATRYDEAASESNTLCGTLEWDFVQQFVETLDAHFGVSDGDWIDESFATAAAAAPTASHADSSTFNSAIFNIIAGVMAKQKEKKLAADAAKANAKAAKLNAKVEAKAAAKAGAAAATKTALEEAHYDGLFDSISNAIEKKKTKQYWQKQRKLEDASRNSLQSKLVRAGYATPEKRVPRSAFDAGTALATGLSSARYDANTVDVSAQIRASHVVGANVVSELVGATESNTLCGTLEWGFVQQFVASFGNSSDAPAALTVHAQAVDFAVAQCADARTAVAASGVSWAPLAREGATMSGPSERYSVVSAALLHDSAATGGARLAVTLAENKTESAPNTFTLLHVALFGRIFAIAPIVLAATDSNGHVATLLDMQAERAWPGYVSARGASTVEVSLPSSVHIAQAFCTREHVLAEPFVSRAMNEALPAVIATEPRLMQQSALIGFDFGCTTDVVALSPFIDCYRRDDVIIARFQGHEWSLRKNHKAVLECLASLYNGKHIVAHEFAVCSPLPQCDDVIELHLLVRVPLPLAAAVASIVKAMPEPAAKV